VRALLIAALLAGCSTEPAPADCGPPPDGGGYQACDDTCRRPSGYFCARGMGMDRCPADDGVNVCDCYTPGGTRWGCTFLFPIPPPDGFLEQRPDGAPPWALCRDDRDCPGGRCIFDPDPLETLGRCGH
jgi:hypothetical protein